MQLKDFFYKIPLLATSGSMDTDVTGLTMDSRKAGPGSLFIAVRGTVTDGHNFIETAIQQGATAILCEEFPTEISARRSLRAGAGFGPDEWAWRPQIFTTSLPRKLKLIGVTGTNGKTSVATLLFRLFRALGYRCGLLSTVQNQIDDEVIPATHTTPDAITTNQLLTKMLAHGCTHVFMEVSSHAVVQERIAGLNVWGGHFHEHHPRSPRFSRHVR